MTHIIYLFHNFIVLYKEPEFRKYYDQSTDTRYWSIQYRRQLCTLKEKTGSEISVIQTYPINAHIWNPINSLNLSWNTHSVTMTRTSVLCAEIWLHSRLFLRPCLLFFSSCKMIISCVTAVNSSHFSSKWEMSVLLLPY
jgi:hypothetical protein